MAKHYKIQIIEETIVLKLQLETVIKTVNLGPIRNPKAFPFKALVHLHTGVRINQNGAFALRNMASSVRDSINMYKAQRDCLINTCCNNRMEITATGVPVARGI